MSILTRRTLPLAARTTFSSTGVSCLQGPHHVAQKSTNTGTVCEAWMTSLAKVWTEPSLMISASPATLGAAAPAKSCIERPLCPGGPSARGPYPAPLDGGSRAALQAHGDRAAAAPARTCQARRLALNTRRRVPSGRSSGVEHNLAKVGVEGSNPFARSKSFKGFPARSDFGLQAACTQSQVHRDRDGLGCGDRWRFVLQPQIGHPAVKGPDHGHAI